MFCFTCSNCQVKFRQVALNIMCTDNVQLSKKNICHGNRSPCYQIELGQNKNEIFNFQSQDGFVAAYIHYYERGSGMLKHHMLEGEEGEAEL
jgi:Na+-transporting NADH:ubiquinone oxidoreductase subunit NqrF